MTDKAKIKPWLEDVTKLLGDAEDVLVVIRTPDGKLKWYWSKGMGYGAVLRSQNLIAAQIAKMELDE